MPITIHFAAGRIELRVYVLREEQRAMPAYEEPPVLPGGSFLLTDGTVLGILVFGSDKYEN